MCNTLNQIKNIHEHGEHWNAWAVDGDRILFFDSFGRDPRDSSSPEIYKDILNRFEIFKYTKTQIQNFMSSTCVYYCIHFLYVLSLGLDFEFYMNECKNDYQMIDIAVVEFVNNL